MIDLHRHDEYSTFDGFGKAKEIAKIAKELGHTSLGIANHGNTNGLIQHYYDCNEQGIKPVLGVECYFQPVFNKEKPRYHLCLFAKDLVGYGNINRILYAAEQHKYYTPLVLFEDLEKHSEGVICTSACIAGIVSQAIEKGNIDLAEKAMKKFKKIFGEDYYIEIQPYKIDEMRTQEKVNVELIKLAVKLKIKCILTSDSHYGSREDFETYKVMHEIAKHNYDIEATYGERFMPTEKELKVRFYKMHKKDFGEEQAKKMSLSMIRNLEQIEDKVEDNILEGLELKLPQMFEGHDSYEVLEKEVRKGLKEKGFGKNKVYIDRCKAELEVIKFHGYSDYFLIVQDYVDWAMKRGINIGPGRGSICNCEVAYIIGITTVDSIKFNLEFRRFMRMDKKSMPDIDLDFETSRRQEVIDYMVDKYKGHAAQICNYGLYKIDNLINDLAKVSGLVVSGKDVSDEEKKSRKIEIAAIKKHIRKYDDENGIDFKSLKATKEFKYYDKEYYNIMTHFSKLYQKVRFIGTHAAGVAITGGNLLDYVTLRIDSKTGKTFSNYDLGDLDRIKIIKFDFLGLKTMEELGELRVLAGKDNYFDISEHIEDEKINERFNKGDTTGIFQFGAATAKNILIDIDSDCFEDITAASAMNRPGPLSLKMPLTYSENKFNKEESMGSKYWDYTKETYGTIVYQEQLMAICTNIGQMTWGEADKVMKIQKRSGQNAAALTGANAKVLEVKDELIEKFVKGAMNNGYKEKEAYDFFQNLLVYTFNKGHAVGYTLISFEAMYYKVYYPTEFWYTKIKYAKDDEEISRFCVNAVGDEAVVFLPHCNYSQARTSIRRTEGENVIQQGFTNLKGVGEKAAEYIVAERDKNGIFKSYDDFYDRCKSRTVTSRVIDIMKDQGTLEFNKKIYISRVTKFNSALYTRVSK
jgi:DNA polymerase-3 subunit alpha